MSLRRASFSSSIMNISPVSAHTHERYFNVISKSVEMKHMYVMWYIGCYVNDQRLNRLRFNKEQCSPFI